LNHLALTSSLNSPCAWRFLYTGRAASATLFVAPLALPVYKSRGERDDLVVD
jgi:hypothetical protein